MEISQSQADEMLALLRETVALLRQRRKQRKRTAIERNCERYIEKASAVNGAKTEREIDRLLLGIKSR